MFGSNKFTTFVKKRQFYEAYITNLENKGKYDNDIQRMRNSQKRSKAEEDFLEYYRVWERFTELALEGQYERAKNILDRADQPREFREERALSVLDYAAERTKDMRCYEMVLYLLEGSNNVELHEFAANMLIRSLDDQPDAYALAEKHWRVCMDNRKHEPRYKEGLLSLYGKPGVTLGDDEAIRLCLEVLQRNPQSPVANSVKDDMIQTEKDLMFQIDDMVHEGKLEEAYALLKDAGAEKPRRVAYRGCWMSNGIEEDNGYLALSYLVAQKEQTAPSYFYAGCAACEPMRKCAGALDIALEMMEKAIELDPKNIFYRERALDQLYLVSPYPMPNEMAKRIAKKLIALDNGNKVAREATAIVREQEKAGLAKRPEV